MMTSLFSIFDPMSSMMSSQMNWIGLFIMMVLFPSMFWMNMSKNMMMWNKLMFFISKELTMLMKNKINIILMVSLFIFIITNNFMGLFPYIFTSTSHLSITLSLALPLWLSLMIFGWMNKPKKMFAHLLPLGTSPILMPFMVMIEIISSLTRPLTLSIRLAANIMAGHLILSLLSKSMSLNSITNFLLPLMSQLPMLILESAVAIIQAYVFSMLISLYSSEI